MTSGPLLKDDVGYWRAMLRTLLAVSDRAAKEVGQRWGTGRNVPMAKPMPLLAPVTAATRVYAIARGRMKQEEDVEGERAP